MIPVFRTRMFLGVVIAIAGLWGGSSPGLQAQSIRGPILGFVPGSSGTVVRPLLGIPGASAFGAPLEFGALVQNIVVSPAQDYAIAESADESGVVVIDLSTGVPAVQPVAGVNFSKGLVAVSPTGLVAAVYDEKASTVWIIGNLPDRADVEHILDVSAIPGSPTDLALTDDGSVVLIKSEDAENGRLWSVDTSGIPVEVPLDQPDAFAFVPHSRDAVITDVTTRSAYLVRDVSRTATRVHLVSAPEGVSGFSSAYADAAGGFVLADAETGVVAVVAAGTQNPVWVSCGCQPTAISPLSGRSVFRLNGASHNATAILDLSSEAPRILIVPPYITQTELN